MKQVEEGDFTETAIRNEVQILQKIFQLDDLGGITNEELEKIMLAVSDEAVLELSRSELHTEAEKAIQILLRRMMNWDENRLLKAIEKNEWRLSDLAKKALIRKMVGEPNDKLEKLLQEKNTVIVSAALKASKWKEVSSAFRKDLGLNPLS